MRTVLDLYSDAMSDAKIIKPNQTASGTNISFVHRKFQDMVRAWSKKRLRLFFVPEMEYALAAAKGSYQIGPGAADFDTGPGVFVRPLFIQTASVVVGTARRWPINILTRPNFEVLQTRSLQDPDGPTDLFYDYNHPLSSFNFAPIPANNCTVYISQWNPLKTFDVGDEQLDVETFYPESYLLPLRTGLAIALCAAYEKQVSQELLGTFQDSVSIIENDNREKLTAAFSFSQTLDGPAKGDGVMAAGVPGQ